MLPFQSHKKILLSLLCLLSLTVLVGCAPKSNRFGIIFASDNNVEGAYDLYRIPDNTQSKVEQLTFTPTLVEYSFLVSKNGDKVVFRVDGTELIVKPSDLAAEEDHHKYLHIYLLDTATKKLKDMTHIFTVPPTTSPMRVVDWSPDEKRFAVITYEGGLQFVDADGTNRKDIPIPSVGDIYPYGPYIINSKWSPDGKKIGVTRVYYAQEPQYPHNEVVIYDLGNGKLVQLANALENCGFASWSPNGQQIAATCTFDKIELGGPTVIRIFSVENPGQPYEHQLFSHCREPAWSPDGKQIAFTCKKGVAGQWGQWGLFIINSDGSGIHEIKPGNLESSASPVEFAWSPDGTQIIYTAWTDDEHSQIYSVHPDGSNNNALTNQEAFYSIVSVYPLP